MERASPPVAEPKPTEELRVAPRQHPEFVAADAPEKARLRSQARAPDLDHRSARVRRAGEGVRNLDRREHCNHHCKALHAVGHSTRTPAGSGSSGTTTISTPGAGTVDTELASGVELASGAELGALGASCAAATRLRAQTTKVAAASPTMAMAIRVICSSSM